MEGNLEEGQLGVEQAEPTVLSGMNLFINPGEFVAVIGKVGSGKTSMLAAILGGLKTQKGVVRSEGKIALVSQTAFMVNNTLRNNITFGKDFDETKYNHIVKICQLKSDFAILPSGDMTEIGKEESTCQEVRSKEYR